MASPPSRTDATVKDVLTGLESIEIWTRQLRAALATLDKEQPLDVKRRLLARVPLVAGGRCPPPVVIPEKKKKKKNRRRRSRETRSHGQPRGAPARRRRADRRLQPALRLLLPERQEAAEHGLGDPAGLDRPAAGLAPVRGAHALHRGRAAARVPADPSGRRVRRGRRDRAAWTSATASSPTAPCSARSRRPSSPSTTSRCS